MNLNYITQRIHIFKKRIYNNRCRAYKLRFGTSGIFSLRNQRFELVYLRGFKKVIRRSSTKRRMRFRYCKFWFFLRPDIILSSKSVNSRMGAGVGSLVRLSKKLKAYKSFIEFKHFSPHTLRKIYRYTRFRYPLNFLVFTRK